MVRVFEDLIDNALRFSPEDSEVSVTAEGGGDQVVISVTDRGCGITPDQIGRIFDPFFTGDPARTHRCASGLGLSICRRVVERHGGRIWAESEGLGCGATVRFSLPRSAAAAGGGKGGSL